MDGEGRYTPLMSKAAFSRRKDRSRGSQGSGRGEAETFSHEAGLLPWVSFGLSPDQHFEEELNITSSALPAERPVMFAMT